jgi:hypothetical protein
MPLASPTARLHLQKRPTLLAVYLIPVDALARQRKSCVGVLGLGHTEKLAPKRSAGHGDGGGPGLG